MAHPARRTAASLLFLGWALAIAATPAQQKEVGPLKVGILRLEWADSARERVVPIKIYYPEEISGPFPVIVFSHGLGGTRDTYEYLGSHWASHGYVAVHLQHHGSDDAVWRESTGLGAAMARSAMNPRNALDRALDVHFALDQLALFDKQASSPLAGRLDLTRVGVAGHSFGAWTTLAVAGQTMARSGARFLDPRVKAAIAMSAPTPPALAMGADAGSIYGGIRIPILHMTGTEDEVPRQLGARSGQGDAAGAGRSGGPGGFAGRAGARSPGGRGAFGGSGGLGGRPGFRSGERPKGGSPADRRIPYDHISHADQYLVTFEGGDHMVFSGRPLGGDRAARDAEFQALIRWGTTVFWDAYLKDDAASKAWLTEGGFAAALGKGAKLEEKIKR
jgi:dienelactone hydrolase